MHPVICHTNLFAARRYLPFGNARPSVHEQWLPSSSPLPGQMVSSVIQYVYMQTETRLHLKLCRKSDLVAVKLTCGRSVIRFLLYLSLLACFSQSTVFPLQQLNFTVNCYVTMCSWSPIIPPSITKHIVKLMNEVK